MTEKKDLENQDWPRIIKELTLYASLRLKFWGLVRNNVKGYEAKDIAFKAIEAVLVGDWNWDQSRSDLLTYLKYHVVKGLVANLARNSEVINLVSSELVDEAEPFNQEDHLNSSMVMEQIFKAIEGDVTASQLVEGLSSGMKRSDICESYQVSTDSYDNALRRLRTKLLKLKERETLKIVYDKDKT